MESAQYVALVRDVTDDQPAPPLPRTADLTIFTKSDLRNRTLSSSEILVSAHTGAGLPKLREALDSLAFGSIRIGARLALNSRHVKAVSDARSSLSQVLSLGSNAPAEVVAMELREAIDALGQVLGNISPDDVLGRIFSRFCIGK
jgi:tRNA modification GTPase